MQNYWPDLIKILPEMHIWSKKSRLNFGSHLDPKWIPIRTVFALRMLLFWNWIVWLFNINANGFGFTARHDRILFIARFLDCLGVNCTMNLCLTAGDIIRPMTTASGAATRRLFTSQTPSRTSVLVESCPSAGQRACPLDWPPTTKLKSRMVKVPRLIPDQHPRWHVRDFGAAPLWLAVCQRLPLCRQLTQAQRRSAFLLLTIGQTDIHFARG